VDSHRELYNAALAERRDAWAHSQTRIRYRDQSGQLTEIRGVRRDVAVWSFSSQQATLRRLNKAFAGFLPGEGRPDPRLSAVQGCGPVRQCVSILRAKAEDAGRTWIEVDPRHTSDRCETADTRHRKVASPKRNFVARHADSLPRPTSWLHATSSGAGLALHTQAA
jgi:transposase